MKAQLTKELYIRTIPFLSLYSIMVLVIMVIYYVESDMFFVLAQSAIWISVIFYINKISVTDSEKQVDWSMFEGALPIRKSDIVNARYIVLSVHCVMLLALGYIILFIKRDSLLDDQWGVSADDAGLFLLVIYFSCITITVATMADMLNNTGFKRFGNFIIPIMLIFTLMMSIFLISDNIYSNSSTYDMMWILGNIGIVCLVLTLAGTYIISSVLLKRKEFC